MSQIECKDFVDKQNETTLESAHEDKLLTFKLTRRNIMTCKTRCIINVKKRENAISVQASYTICNSNFRHLFFFYGWHVSKMYHNFVLFLHTFVSPYFPIKSTVWIYLVYVTSHYLTLEKNNSKYINRSELYRGKGNIYYNDFVLKEAVHKCFSFNTVA